MTMPSDVDLVDAYVELGSIWKVAEMFGTRGQAVHYRLAKIGAIKPMRKFSRDEERLLIEYYRDTPPSEFCLKRLSLAMGRTRQFLCRKAKELGLTNKARPLSDARVEKMKSFTWEGREHPRGHSGKLHSEEARKRIADASSTAWAAMKRDGTGNMGADYRQAKSDSMMKMRAAQPVENAYSRTKSGKREDLGGMFFRSAWEANYARYLNWLQAKGEIDKWEYEADTFWFLAIKRGVRSYKPDFKITEKGSVYYVEVKGWMDDKSKTKLKRMKKYHPDVKIVVVDGKQYASIKAAVSRLIEGWE